MTFKYIAFFIAAVFFTEWQNSGVAGFFLFVFLAALDLIFYGHRHVKF